MSTLSVGAVWGRDMDAPWGFAVVEASVTHQPRHLGVSENRGPQYSTPNSRILIIRTPK